MTRANIRIAELCLLLIVSLCSPGLMAQQSRLDELNSQVVALYQQGKYGEAIPIAIEEVKEAEDTFGSDDPALATVLNNLAELYQGQGKYADAEPLYQRALRIDEKALGPDRPDVAMALNNLAGLYQVQSRYAEAEPLYRRSLTIWEKALGPDHPDVAQSLTKLAELYEAQGKFEDAEPLYQRSLAIREKALGPDHPDVATTLNDLAQLYSAQGKYNDVEPLYQRALRIDEKALGPDHPDVATALNNLAVFYEEQGKYPEAEPLLQRSLAIREKALGPDHPDVAAVLNNVAALYEAQGKYGEAEPFYRRSLTIMEKMLGPDHPNVAIALNNLAELYEAQGKYAGAQPLFQRSLAILEKTLGSDHPDVAQALNNLAALYWNEGKPAEAEPLLQRALRIDEKALGPDHPGVAMDLNNLAKHYDDEGKYSDAEPLYQRSLAIMEKTLGPDHPYVATAFNNLAALYLAQGRYADAEPLFQSSLAIREKALGPDHPDVSMTFSNLAELYRAQGKYSDAEPFFQKTLDSLFRQFQYSFTYMTEKERLAFLDSVDYQFSGYFSFAHRYRQQDPGLTGSMYNLQLWEKGLIAASIAGMRRQVEASGDKQALDLLDQLAAKRTQIATLLNIDPPDRDLWRKQIDQLRTEADGIEKSLIARSSAFAEQHKLDRATWQQVRDALGPREAAVEFVRFHYFEKKWTDTYYYVALVVTHETKDYPEYIVLGDSSQIEGGVAAHFQYALHARGFANMQNATLPGKQAYDLIWKPLEAALAGKTRIYISLDGALNQIPLGLIPTPDGKLLMERYELRLLSSTKDILRAATPRSSNTALLVGDPNFDLSEDQQRVALGKLASSQSPANLQLAALSPNDISRDATDSSSQLPSLPGTGAEISAIVGLMQGRGWKTGVYLQDTALKRVVEQISGQRVLHVATHGFFLSDQQVKLTPFETGEPDLPSGLEDPMLRSGLYFAGANRTLAGKPTPVGLDNGVLTAMEAGSLNLTGTELVVLSACNTGQGDVKNSEGVFGLRRALQEAGAQAVLMSLWSVPDKETQELMQRFYSKWLSGMEMHEALKQAQLEEREEVKREHGGHDLPYYWGAFVLVGR